MNCLVVRASKARKNSADSGDDDLLKKKKKKEHINISNTLNNRKTKPQRSLRKSTAGVKWQSVTEVHDVFV